MPTPAMSNRINYNKVKSFCKKIQFDMKPLVGNSEQHIFSTLFINSLYYFESITITSQA